MDKRSTFTILGIVVLALGVFVAVSIERSKINDASQVAGATWADTPAQKPTDLNVTQRTVITAKHAYINGAHIIAGEIPLPTPCHILEATTTVPVDKKQVFVIFTSSIKSGENCAEAVTPARFKLTTKAAKDAVLTATLNGQDVTLNLLEAGPNENLDNFELYIKG